MVLLYIGCLSSWSLYRPTGWLIPDRNFFPCVRIKMLLEKGETVGNRVEREHWTCHPCICYQGSGQTWMWPCFLVPLRTTLNLGPTEADARLVMRRSWLDLVSGVTLELTSELAQDWIELPSPPPFGSEHDVLMYSFSVACLVISTNFFSVLFATVTNFDW